MKPVYIVGAGCSVAGGAPVVANFKAAAEWVGSQEHLFATRPYGIFHNALKWWNERAPAANIEEFYVLIELLERIESPEEVGVADAVRYLISKTLQVQMSDRNPRADPQVSRRFIARLLDLHLPSPPALITLNWDLALDNSCEELGVAYHYGYQDARSLDSGHQLSRGEGAFPLLKLHGSFNWWACCSCGTLWFMDREKDILGQWEYPGQRVCRSAPCVDEGGQVQLLPLMVPPTSQKFEKASPFHPILSSVWREAESALRTCTNLIIAGYSFPPTDVQFRMFVMHALRTNEQLQRVTIVSSPKFGRERPDFEDGYLRVFSAAPQHRSKLTFHYEKFEEWVAREGSLMV